MGRMPALRLLVSVCGVEEAIAALRGGVDIIDVKNPEEGALGANFPWVLKEVRRFLGPSVEMSGTIGDMPNLPGTASLAALGATLSGVDYVKVGLFGTKSFDEALYLMKSVVRSVKDHNSKARVIAGGYADYAQFGALKAMALPQVAYKAGADGILIDVREKGGLKLMDFLEPSQLMNLVDEAHKLSLIIGLAGGLAKGDVALMKGLGADIMGVRRGVCERGPNPYGRVDEFLVRDIMRAIREPTGIFSP